MINRKQALNKAAAQKSHFFRRLKQRWGFSITGEQYESLILDAQKATAMDLDWFQRAIANPEQILQED